MRYFIRRFIHFLDKGNVKLKNLTFRREKAAEMHGVINMQGNSEASEQIIILFFRQYSGVGIIRPPLNGIISYNSQPLIHFPTPMY